MSIADVLGEDVTLPTDDDGDEADAGTENQPEGEQQAPAEQQPAQKEPEGQTQEDEDAAPAADDKRTVPYGALHEERQRRKELQQEVQRMQQAQAQRDEVLNQRLQLMQQQFAQQQQQPAQAQPQIPSLEQDPIGHFTAQIEQLPQQLAHAQQFQGQVQAQQQEAANMQAMHGVVRQHEVDFEQRTPDYAEAVNFLQQNRLNELQALGVPPAQAVQQVRTEARNLVLHFMNQRVPNVAEATYNFAKARGYTPKQAAAAAATAAAAVATPDPAQKMQAMAKIAGAAQSLGSAGAAQNGLSLESLANMSDDDFAKATNGGNWAKLMGG